MVRPSGARRLVFLLFLPACTPEPAVIRDLPKPVAGRSATAYRRRSTPLRPITLSPLRVAPESGDAGWFPAIGISPRWECIVIHHSATEVGGAQRFDELHRAPPRSWDELGYHFVIGNGTDTPDGHIEVGPRWAKQKHGAHCKTPGNHFNEHGIGIGLVGNFENHPPTRAQMRSLTRLVRFLQDRCSIPTSKVVSHSGVTGKTLCPGRYFDLAALRSRLAGPTYAAQY
jgi:hypothetical protein